MITGHKHLVKCRCILPQFKKVDPPPPHHFPVFSIVGEDNKVVSKYAQCNNCGIIHRVIDFCTSEMVVGKENMNSIVKIEDIKCFLNPNFVTILEANSSDLATWECIKFIVENKRWGEFVVLTSEQDGEEINGKYMRILSDSLCQIETFNRSVGVVK
jgi:hypothetical protein